MEEYALMFHRHESDWREAMDRIKVWRGDERRDDSSESGTKENEESLHRRNEDDKQRLFAERDRELIRTVESLTHQLKTVTEEKDTLHISCSELSDLLDQVSSQYDQLEFAHDQLTNDFFAPILSYAQGLQLTSERQHSIILEMTSLVHSLRSSLELTRSASQTQFVESQYAVETIATAAGVFASRQTQLYETERASYMKRMEERLTQTEEEALGAVRAVAEAAGRLEYERKVEEESRWRSYVKEVEKTLDGIGRGTESDVLSHIGDEEDEFSRESSREGTGEDDNDWENGLEGAEDLRDMTETSVLRAAITRRIEEGMASLRKYVHPYNYLREEREVYPWESPSQE
jgi:hypothetical protein